MIQRFVKWLKERFQKMLNWFYKSSAVVMAIVAIIMCLSLLQNRKALQMTRESLDAIKESLELQRKEFRLKIRPLISIKGHKFEIKEGQSDSHIIEMYIENISEVAANQVKGSHQVFLNEELIEHLQINSSSTVAIAKGSEVILPIPLTKDTYSNAMNEKNRLKVVTKLTYSGMLGEEADAYKTSTTVYYYVPQKTFKCEYTKYE